MPAFGNPKKTTEMSHGELVASLVALNVIGSLIGATTFVSLVRDFSIFALVGAMFVLAILIGAWDEYGGELRRRSG